MAEVKHTPGPWTVDGPPHNQIVWADALNRVCFLAHSNGRDPERDIATGRLIAAAPDLLEALRLYEVYDAMPSDRGGRNGPRGKAYQAFVDAKAAALAKAEGRP